MEVEGAEKWIGDALNYMRASCPTTLKIWRRSVREGRVQSIEQCLIREYNISCHIVRRTVSNDFYEGSRAKLFDKDNKDMWDPPKLELVSEEMVDQYFRRRELRVSATSSQIKHAQQALVRSMEMQRPFI